MERVSSFRAFINRILKRAKEGAEVTKDDLRDLGLNMEEGGVVAQNESFMYFCRERKKGLERQKFCSEDVYSYLNNSLQNFSNNLRNLLIILIAD